MTPGIQDRPTSVFTPQAVASLNRAYAMALDMLAREEGAREHRVRIAEHMMFLARNGETDEDRLCRLAIFAILGRWPGERTAARR